MILTKNKKIVISVVIALVLFFIYVFFERKSEDLVETEKVATTTDQVSITEESQNTGDYKIEQIGFSGSENLLPIPDLNRKPVMSDGATISEEAKKMAAEKILILQNRLKNNQKDIEAWIDLGIYQKMAGDYEGSIISWKYVNYLAPTDYVSLANLGNLYAYFLKDNGQAEMYYKKAISKGPTQVYLYVQLAEIYRDIFKDLDKARAIIDQGLSKLPTDPNLLQLQLQISH